MCQAWPAFLQNKIKVKENSNGKYVIATEFFTWAIEKWPELKKIGSSEKLVGKTE